MIKKTLLIMTKVTISMRDYQVRDLEKTATGDGVPCANLINNEYTLWDRG